METMDYNRINGEKKGPGLFVFFFFVIVGTITIIYLMMNEPEPLIIGQDAMVDIYNEDVLNFEIDTSYEVNEIKIMDSDSNFKSNIYIPEIIVAKEPLEEINEEIYNKFVERYEHLKTENEENLENKFTYKLSFQEYYNEFENGKKILSIRIYERIVDDNLAKLTTYNVYGYNIDLETKEILTQEDIASVCLGTDFNKLIRNQVKTYVIENEMITAEEYKYSITGLEESYIKEGKFVIVFNKEQIVDAKHGYLEITINKMEE